MKLRVGGKKRTVARKQDVIVIPVTEVPARHLDIKHNPCTTSTEFCVTNL